MIIFPAIDLRHGRCVRLRQGDPNAETVFGEDPVAMARHWVEQGAQWLHVINLDGAFQRDGEIDDASTGSGLNLQRLRDICRTANAPVQFGGGLRTLDDVALALELGVRRVILGTVAVQNPDLVAEACARFGAERIVVGIDALDGKVATHGWQETSALEAVELGRRMRALGVVRAVYTDISRDGMLTGVNVEGTARLAEESGLKVIASGGVAGIEDIKRLRAEAHRGIEGVITGQAIYTGALDLAEAIAVAGGLTPHGRRVGRD